VKLFRCGLVGGPFDGDEGTIRHSDRPQTIWAGHCKPISKCREIHWTLDHVQAADLGYERYGYEQTRDDVHVYVCADVASGPGGSVRVLEEIPVSG
jgi:hypothetical protein